MACSLSAGVGLRESSGLFLPLVAEALDIFGAFPERACGSALD